MAYLRENGISETDNKDKADIFKGQFVYTREQIRDRHIQKDPDQNRVKKLLDRLNLDKSSGPDNPNACLLKECSAEMVLILACIFNQSLAQARVLDEWLQANVDPIYKDVEKYDPANNTCRSVSRICCMSLEHIIVSRIMQYLTDHKLRLSMASEVVGNARPN